MTNDVDFLKSRLARVEGFGDTGDYLNKIINAKEVKKAEVKKAEVKEEEPAPAASDAANEKEDEKAGDASASAEPVKDEEKK